MTAPSDAAANPPLSAPTGRVGDPAWYTRQIEVVIYVVAGVAYVGLGMFHKFLLNWIIGPLWLIAWVWLVPVVVDRFRRGDRRGDRR